MNTRWSPLFKQVVVAGGLILSIWLLYRVRVLLAPLILALFLAYFVSFPVNWLVRHTGWKRTLVIVLVQCIVVLLLVVTPVLIIPWLVALVGSFGSTLAKVAQELLNVTPRPVTLSPSITIDLGPFYAPINQALRSVLAPDIISVQGLQSFLKPFASSAAVVVRGAVSGVVWGIFVIAVSFYTVKDAPRFARYAMQRAPQQWRPEFTRLWREMVLIWDSFIRGQFTLGILMGIIVWLAMTFLGVRNAPALGLLSGIFEFVPAVGPVLAAIPGVLIALILGSTWMPLPSLGFAILVAIVYFTLSQFENMYLLPRVVGKRVALHPAVVIIGALAGAQLGGVLGILLAAPTIAIFKLLLTYSVRKLFDQDPFPDRAANGPKDRQLLWGEQVRARMVRAVLFDLDGTLIETDDELVERMVGRLHILQRVFSENATKRVVRRFLMESESFVNGLITALDRLRLDRFAFRMNDLLRRLRGVRSSDQFVAVAGSTDMLAGLTKRYLLAIVTSRKRSEAELFVRQFGLEGVFAVIVTRDDVARMKPHPMPIKLAADRLGVTPGECVMVGDTNVDVRAAKAAGALAIGVLCGFGEPGDLEDADLVIDSTAQLGAWL